MSNRPNTHDIKDKLLVELMHEENNKITLNPTIKCDKKVTQTETEKSYTNTIDNEQSMHETQQPIQNKNNEYENTMTDNIESEFDSLSKKVIYLLTCYYFIYILFVKLIDNDDTFIADGMFCFLFASM